MKYKTDNPPLDSQNPTLPLLDTAKTARELRRFFELHQFGIDLVLAGLRYDFPNADERELKRRLRDRLEISRRDKWRGAK